MNLRFKIKALHRLLARRKSFLFTEAVFFWLLFVAGLYLFVGFLVVPAVVEAKIEKLCGREVSIESGRFKGFNTIRLKGIVIAGDSAESTDTSTLQADEIEISFNRWHLLRGRFTVNTVKLEDFLVTAEYDSANKNWNVADLFVQSDHSSKQNSIPLIDLKRGALRIRLADANGFKKITTISLNGKIAEKTGKDEYAFLLETDGRFGYGPSRLQGRFKTNSMDSKKQIQLTGQIQTPQAGILQNNWNLNDIQVECLFDDEFITIRKCDFLLGDSQCDIKGQVGLKNDLWIKLDVNLDDITIAEYLTPNAIVYHQAQEYITPGLRNFLTRYHPTGLADVEMKVDASLKNLAVSHLLGRIYCRDITAQDDKFPYLIEDLSGEIEFTGRTLHLAGLNARHGDVQMKIKGKVENFGPQPTIDMLTSSPNMKLDDDFFRALSAPTRDPNDAMMWYQLTPSGVTEFAYRFHESPDEQSDQTITFKLIDASAMYKYFQYPLQHLTGTITIEPDRVQLSNIISKYDNDSQIEINGEIFNYHKPDKLFQITCRGTDIPIDKQLIGAMPPRQQTILESLNIQGDVDFNVDVFPNQITKQPDYSAKIKLDQGALKADAFPLSMNNIDASMTVTQDVSLLHHFDAQTQSGRIHLNESKLYPTGQDPNGPGMCLNLDVNNFELNESFWQAIDPAVERKFRLRGAIDANGLLEVNLPEGMSKGNNLAIDFAGNQLLWDVAEIGLMNGRLTVKNDEINFSEFALTDVALEALPREMMNQKAKTVYNSTAPSGVAAVRIQDGYLKMSPQGLSLLDVHAGIDLEGLSFGQTKTLHQVDGLCQGHFVFDANTNHWQTQARYEIERFFYKNCLITGVSGDLVRDPNTMKLESKNFTAQFYDGSVVGNLEIDLPSQNSPTYKLELNYDDVNLNKLMASIKKTMRQEQAVKGNLAGRLVLTGNLDDLSEPRGKFDTTIVDLEMGRQSLLGKILTAVQLKRPENFVFSEIGLKADILGPELIFNRIRMVGNPLVFDGTGKMNMETGQMAIELVAWDRGTKDKESILDILARGIGSALWKVEIHGDVNAPEVAAVYLSVLKQPLNIFKKNDD